MNTCTTQGCNGIERIAIWCPNLNEDKWANDLIQISKKAAYLRESIDSKALKADAPEIYEKYKKETKVSESLTYKIL